MITSEIGLLISAVVMICSLLTFAFSRTNDNGERKYWQGQTTNQLEQIGGDVKDMKAQQRSYEHQLTETREIANLAKQSASKAHKRLDAINAPGAYGDD